MPEKPQRPWIIAHRGARDEAPENTLLALQQALRYDIDGVEFDVQMGADGTLVLYHDRTLYKIYGRRQRVADLGRRELAAMDWGRWYAPRFAGTPLTTFEKVLESLKPHPRMLVEIKSSPADRASGHADRLTEKVMAAIAQADGAAVEHQVLLLSFDPEVLVVARQLDPRIRLVLNLPESKPLAMQPRTDHLWAVGVRISQLSADLVKWARGQHLRVFTYTCNGPRQVQKALDLHADAIITDRPRWLVQRCRP